MRLTLALLIPLLPAVAVAQDSVTVAVPQGRNCSDFVSQQDAQGWYDAVAIITGQPDAHGLDSDSDGQPCEGLQWAKVEQVAPEYQIRYDLIPQEVTCSMIEGPIQLDDLRSEVVGQTRATVPRRDSIGYDLLWDCLHLLHSEATE